MYRVKSWKPLRFPCGAAVFSLAVPFLVAAQLLLLSSFAGAHSLPVTSNFGWRIHPISGEWKFHAGVDLGYDYGTPVSALFDGIVVLAGNYGDGYGNQVLVYHDSNDTYTRYGHMQAVYVSPGDRVGTDGVLGEVGSTGNSTGPHLHFEYAVPDGNGGYTYADPLCLF